ncbi:MAG: hypothetical protein HUJ72_12910 [Blautia sp.]|nr:hypothetical protein [Blautia sp.]
MKAFTAFIEKIRQKPRLSFALQVLGFYAMMMAIYLYYMLANLSSAPQFVYTAF